MGRNRVMDREKARDSENKRQRETQQEREGKLTASCESPRGPRLPASSC